MAGTVRIGISGWRYAPWRGVFYPDELPQRAELAYASRRLGSIELNGSFYSLQRPASYQAWHDATPPGFVFAIKGGRYITHLKRLRGGASLLANFFASGVLRLEDKLGPFLWQLPPNFRYDAARLEEFFAALPRSARAAAELGGRHDAWMKGRTWLEVTKDRPLRHALEVRHASFATPEFIALLRRHGIALVVADTAGKWPFLEDLTSDFVYVRLHGDEELYASGYSATALGQWADKLAMWRRGEQHPDARTIGDAVAALPTRDVYVYFDNDIKVHAPFDAQSLAHRLGLGPAPEKATLDAAAIASAADDVPALWTLAAAERKQPPAPTRPAGAARPRAARPSRARGATR